MKPEKHYIAAVSCLLIFLLCALPCYAQEGEEIQFVPPLKQLWQAQIEGREATGYQITMFASPRFDERHIYFASTNGVLYSVFKGTWETSWEFHTAAPITLELALAGKTICLTDGSTVYALDARTGVPLWLHSAPSTVTSGLVSHGESVFYADVLGSVRCLSISTGELIWEFKPTVEEGSESSASIRSGMHVDDTYLIYGDDRGFATALNSSTGVKIWTFKTGGPIQSGFMRKEQRLFFGSDDNFVYCLNVQRGILNWRQRTAGDVRGKPVCDDEFVFITSRDRSLRAINYRNGYPARVGPISLPTNFDFQPLIVDDILFAPHGATALVPRITEGTFRGLPSYSNPAGEISTSLVYDADEKFLYFGTRLGRFVVLAPDALKLDEFLLSPEVASDIDFPAIDPEPEENTPRRERRNRQQEPEDTSSPEIEKKEDPAPMEPPPESEQAVPEESETEETEKPETTEDTNTGAPVAQPTALQTQLARGREMIRNGDFAGASSIFAETLSTDPQKYYTINLGLYCQPESINSLIETLRNDELIIFSRVRDEETCYFMCVGLYETREQAEIAIEDLELNDRVEANINALRLDSFIPVN